MPCPVTWRLGDPGMTPATSCLPRVPRATSPRAPAGWQLCQELTEPASRSPAPCLPCSEHDLGEDIYDCVPCEEEGDDIYEDIIKVEVQQPMVSGDPGQPGRWVVPGCCHPVGAASCPCARVRRPRVQPAFPSPHARVPGRGGLVCSWPF